MKKQLTHQYYNQVYMLLFSKQKTNITKQNLLKNKNQKYE